MIPPITAIETLIKVPIRKYSAKRASFSSGKRAIDLPVRITPTIAGDWPAIAVMIKNLSTPTYVHSGVLELLWNFGCPSHP